MMSLKRFQSRNGLIWTLRTGDVFGHGKTFQSRNGLIWTQTLTTQTYTDLQFQSRNGLIWTGITMSCGLVVLAFQSRNGLIWTIDVFGIMKYQICFNPATVWFEPMKTVPDTLLSYRFNPATVWFERGIGEAIKSALRLFQSRNGLIWTMFFQAASGG